MLEEYVNEKTSNKPCSSESAVPFVDLTRQYQLHRKEILQTVDGVLSSGNYILGPEVELFEKELAHYLGCRFVLGVANGTDALMLVLKSFKIGVGDEVIVPVNSFLATAGSVVSVGSTPILCDVQEDLNLDINKVASLITPRTKAVMPVHLTGRPADMTSLMQLATQHNLYVIEDAAQAIGARYHNKRVGTIGHAGCFSLHPLKNLHIYGDGGFISTDDESLYNDLKLLRNHGLMNRDVCLHWGFNSRLDSLQAAIGRICLPYLDAWNERRRQNAAIYQKHLKAYVTVPVDEPHSYAIYHNFVIYTEMRDQLMSYLADKKIETKIHYPIQIYAQPAALSLGYKREDFPMANKLAEQMLSLPVYSELRDDELAKVVASIVSFFEKHQNS